MWDLGSLRPQYDVTNLGHGGLTSRQLLLQLLSEPATRSQFAVLQVGINDIHPLGVLPQQRAQILGRLEENLRSIVATLRDRADVVVVSTVIPPGSVPLQRRLTWDHQSLAYIARVNDVLRELCDGKRVVLLDAHRLLGKYDGWLQPAYADADFFLHINAAGYAVLNLELLRLLGGGGARTAQPRGEALRDSIDAPAAEVGATGESPAIHAFGG
jgi:lysophospholipase L1-like esterase